MDITGGDGGGRSPKADTGEASVRLMHLGLQIQPQWWQPCRSELGIVRKNKVKGDYYHSHFTDETLSTKEELPPYTQFLGAPGS